MIVFLLSLILIILCIIAMHLHRINENVVTAAYKSNQNSAELILELRGIKAGVWLEYDGEQEKYVPVQPPT